MAFKGIKKTCPAFLPALASVIFILFSATFPAATSAGSPAGSIDSLSGAAYLKAKDSERWAVASKGMEVGPGDRVKTGSDGKLSIRFSDGSRLNVGNLSELEITEYILKPKKRIAVYSLSAGKLRAIINKFSGSTDIKVKTPTSTSGVKGTDFIVMNQGPANILFGKEDTVSVSGESSGVELKPGSMTENTRGGSPIEPVAVEPGSALEGVRADLEAVTDVEKPVEWERAGRVPEILARWNINYGSYLADSKRFKDSLDVFQIALDLTDLPSIRAEAHLDRGTVLSRNLKEPARALKEYMEVVDKYPEPPFAENALFSAGLINMELGEKAPALNLFRRYRAEYPEGIHKDTVELFIRVLESD